MQKFSHDYINVDSSGDEVKMEHVVRVCRTPMQLSTVWTLEKFREKLVLLRELYEKAKTSGTETADDEEEDEDVFFGSDDAWVASPSLSDSSKLLSPHL